VNTIPFLSLNYQHEVIQEQVTKSLTAVFKKNWFILGKELESFEAEFSNYVGTTYTIGVGNGLDALTIALLSCGITKGDEVIVPAHTYLATWLAVSRTGATIIPVEPFARTYNIDTSRIESVISSKTKAIIPVHMYGQASDMTTLDTIARKYNLFIIEDNAQAHGSSWLEKKTGSYGVMNATSFYPTKNLGALGDGGAITSNDTLKVEFCKRYRNYGFEQKHIGLEQGVNSRLDEMQAAVLRIKLKYLKDWNEQRRQLASQYLMELKEVGDIILPLSDKEAYHVYHLFVIRAAQRDKLKEHLMHKGIESMIHYPIPPHLQKTYAELKLNKGSFPITENIAETILSLPLWPGMTTDQISFICNSIKKFF